jgi:hypothetical protein
MIELMQVKIKSLRDEITAIDYTNSMSNLSETLYDNKNVMCLKAKIQVINELIISYGIKK